MPPLHASRNARALYASLNARVRNRGAGDKFEQHDALIVPTDAIYEPPAARTSVHLTDGESVHSDDSYVP